MHKFPTALPRTPWEASALLVNTGIAAGVPNTAKLDRLTYLESVVANLLLGQPATLGLAALPPVRAVSVTHGVRMVGLEPGDVAGAHFVALAIGEDDTIGTALIASLKTPTAVEIVEAYPGSVPGDAWLLLVTNATTAPFAMDPMRGVSGQVDVAIPPGGSQLFLVTIVSMTDVTFAPILAGVASSLVHP